MFAETRLKWLMDVILIQVIRQLFTHHFLKDVGQEWELRNRPKAVGSKPTFFSNGSTMACLKALGNTTVDKKRLGVW